MPVTPTEPHVEGMAVRQRRFSGLCFDDRNAMPFRKGRKRLAGFGIQHAAAGNDDRLCRCFEHRDRMGQFVRIGMQAARGPDFFVKEAFGIIIGFRLHILAERQRDRAAIGGIGQHLHGAAQRRDDLFGAGDAVEIARNRAEAVVDGHRAVAEILDLLEDRIRTAIGKDIAREKQDRQAVDMGKGCRCHHVECAGADGRGAGHEAAAEACLGKGDRRICHALLVLGAVGRQRVLDAMQRLADTGDIAMAENGEDTAEDRGLLTVNHGHLLGQKPRDGLRHGQANGLVAHCFLLERGHCLDFPLHTLPLRGRVGPQVRGGVTPAVPNGSPPPAAPLRPPPSRGR